MKSVSVGLCESDAGIVRKTPGLDPEAEVDPSAVPAKRSRHRYQNVQPGETQSLWPSRWPGTAAAAADAGSCIITLSITQSRRRELVVHRVLVIIPRLSRACGPQAAGSLAHLTIGPMFCLWHFTMIQCCIHSQ